MMRRLCLLLLAVAVPPPFVQSAEPEKYLPNATQAVVTVNVKAFLESPLFKDNLDGLKQAWKQLGIDHAITGYLGLDPFTDIERIQFVTTGNPEDNLVLLHGGFDTAKVQTALEKAAKDAKKHVATHHTTRHMFFQLQLNAEDDEKYLYAAPLSDGVIALSTNSERVSEALDKKAGKRKTELRKDVQALLARADARHAISIASLSGPLSFAGLLGNAPNNLQNVSGGVVLGEDVKLELTMQARDIPSAKAAATTLTDQLNQLKAAVAVLVTQQKQFMPLAELVNGVRVAAQSNEVTFKLTISKELVDSVFKKE